MSNLKSIISASINLSKIDKNIDIQTDNAGNKYLNIDIFINQEPNQYGKDVSIAVRQSKDERESKKPKKYLGSGLTVFPKSESKPQQSSSNNDGNDIITGNNSFDDF